MQEKSIRELSPLFDYWSSSQNTEDFNKILSIVNRDHPASVLLSKEPYKWEILFQSILNEIKNGDKTSLKGLLILINCITEKQKVILIKSLIENNLITKGSLDLKNSPISKKQPGAKNAARFLRILFAIFLNRYGVNLKGEKNHIYEYTGMISYGIRSFLGLIR